MRKSFLIRIHAVAGLFAGLFILLMSISGSLLVFHEELDELQFPNVTFIAGRGNITSDSALAAVKHYFPNARISSLLLPLTAKSPFVFSLATPTAPVAIQAFLHPQTGELLGTRGGGTDVRHNFMGWLAGFHNSFRLGKTGEWLLVFFALLFIVSLLTGMLLYRRQLVPVLSFKRSIYRRRNLHQVIGTWALLFNLMIAITGFWMQRYVFKKSFYASSVPYKQVVTKSPPLAFKIDSSLSGIKNTHADFTPYVLYFPQAANGKTAVYGSRASNSFIHSKKYADRVMLDSAGHIASTAFVTDISADDRYDIINAQVHYGRYGGWGVKLLYVLFGLSGAILSITGFLLWIRKNLH